ncbi:type IV pilus inner membrane component PilO [Psychrobacter aquaticus]|uniref:Type IV pilus biogenesis protein PilO n=1 Tax=Psychrobacter aquaticus CMS 56 TaxID=1354303 RepID=U4T6T7_9GAMM|nr:type 4a pilus biogenesis protein PilO [Psychrobacter aquaticus]ERL56620.1 Type IV pilus biogenesis protein PilO [Psychrobacter aquaticus CMS 56]
MKLIRKKSLIKTKKTALKPKKQFDLQEFRRSFESLDSENYGSWPLPVKVTVIGLIITFIAALAWALPISSKIDEIKAAESQQTTLLDSYREKESRARHLTAYQEQVVQMETEFNTLLDQLPKDTRVSELVEGINMTGVGSNIRFQDISVEPEIENEFFIEQPIRIAALGEYHQFGSFISGLAALPRIITMHDFEVSNPQPTLDVLPELNLVLQTKTYRSKEATPEGEEATPTDGAAATTAATTDTAGAN